MALFRRETPIPQPVAQQQEAPQTSGFDLSSAQALSVIEKPAPVNNANMFNTTLGNIRSVGIPMGMAAGGLQGSSRADAPFILSKLGSGLLQGVPEAITQKPTSFALGGVPSVMAPGGKDAKVLGAGIPKLPFPKPDTTAGRVAGEAVDFLGSTLTGAIPIGKAGFGMASRVARDAIREQKRAGVLGKAVSRAEEVAERTIKLKQQKAIDVLENSTRELVVKLKGSARAGTLKAQKLVVPWMRKNSDGYADAIEDGMKASGKTITRKTLSDALEDAVETLGLRGQKDRGPMMRSESKLLELSEEFFDISRRSEQISFDEAMRVKRAIQQTTAGASRGVSKAYTYADHVAGTFYEALGKQLSPIIKGFPEINKKYARYASFRRKFLGILRPLGKASELETGIGEELISRVGRGSSSATDKVIVQALEAELGQNLTQGTKAVADQISRTKQAIKQTKRMPVDEIKKKMAQEALRGPVSTKSGKIINVTPQRRITIAERVSERSKKRAGNIKKGVSIAAATAALMGFLRRKGASFDLTDNE